MADKLGAERKVWVLPTELSDRIRMYQTSQGIGSEVEAARRLLDAALQMRDTVEEILKRLLDRHKIEKDLRVLARDILTTHPLVQDISIKDTNLLFCLRSGTYGQLDADGDVWSGTDPEYLVPCEIKPKVAPRAVPVQKASKPTSGGWDDADDEIPF